MPTPAQSPDKAPPCRKCLYFQVTWDAAFPWGCRVFGVKTSGIPAMNVFQSTGRHCPSFEKNPKIKEG